MKKVLVALLMIGVALYLVGCGKASSSADDSPSQSVVYSSTDDEAFALQQIQRVLSNSLTPTNSVGAFSIQNGESIPASVYFKGTSMSLQSETAPSSNVFPSTWYNVMYNGTKYWLTALSRSQNGDYRISFRTKSFFNGQ